MCMYITVTVTAGGTWQVQLGASHVLAGASNCHYYVSCRCIAVQKTYLEWQRHPCHADTQPVLQAEGLECCSRLCLCCHSCCSPNCCSCRAGLGPRASAALWPCRQHQRGGSALKHTKFRAKQGCYVQFTACQAPSAIMIGLEGRTAKTTSVITSAKHNQLSMGADC